MMRDRSTSVKGESEAPAIDGRLDNVLFNVWLVSRATNGLLDRALRPAGLDGDEFALYSLLLAGDGATPSDLARWMAAPPTTVSSYVKRLERRGHAEREANPDDRRSYRLRLTAAGRAAHAEAGALFLPALAAVRAGLGPDEGTVTEALHAVRQALYAAGNP